MQGPITAFSQAAKGSAADRSYDGAIGGEILRRFKLIFDYSRRQLVLEPNGSISDPFEADMSGLSLSAHGDGFQTVRCDNVDPGSPAAEAGIVPGDILQAIDGQPVVGAMLPRLHELLRVDGKTYALQIQRGDQRLEVRLTTRRRV
jgi:C-terminal processing protease CtpA/Prc